MNSYADAATILVLINTILTTAVSAALGFGISGALALAAFIILLFLAFAHTEFRPGQYKGKRLGELALIVLVIGAAATLITGTLPLALIAFTLITAPVLVGM